MGQYYERSKTGVSVFTTAVEREHVEWALFGMLMEAK